MENNGITFEFGLPSNNCSSLISTLTTFPGCFPTTLLIDIWWQSCHCRLSHWAVWSKANLCWYFGPGCAARGHQQGLRDTKKVGQPLTYNFTHKCLLTLRGKAAELRGESRGRAFLQSAHITSMWGDNSEGLSRIQSLLNISMTNKDMLTHMKMAGYKT